MQVVLFEPYPLQKEFIDRFIATDDLIGVVSSSRGSGKSLLSLNMMLFWMLDQDNQQGAYVCPVYRQCRNVFDQIIEGNEAIIKSSNRMELQIRLINGSTIKFLSADSPDSIRGFRFTHVICDEAAFMKDRIIDQYIMPTLNPNGKKLLLISTPKGKNAFYEYFMRESTVSMRFPLSECPYVKPEVIGEAKKSLPPSIFKQEFEAEFMDSGNDVFVGVDQVSSIREWSIRREDVFVGVDTGLSSDMSVICVMNPTGRVLNMYAINNENINVIADTFKGILTNYNVVGGMIEGNGIGAAMFDLINPSYRKIKKFFMSQQSKQDIVRKLITDIQTYTIELPTRDLCPELHTELSTYTYKLSANGKLSFGHVPGANDDYLDALMMSNYSRVKFLDRGSITVGSFRKTTPMFRKPN